MNCALSVHNLLALHDLSNCLHANSLAHSITSWFIIEIMHLCTTQHHNPAYIIFIMPSRMMRALCILRSMCDVKKKCRKKKKKKESNRNFVKSPNEGGNKELIAVPRLGNPVKRSGPWFSIWQWTRRDSDALIWGGKKAQTFNWLYKLCGFFSTGRLKCLCVLCLPWASPRERSPFKRILKEDESLLIQGRQKYNSHDMLSSSHAPTDWSAFVTSSPLRRKACCACRLLPERLRSI